MYSKQENIRMVKRSLDMMVYNRMLIAIGIGLALGLLYGWAQFRKENFDGFGYFLAVTAVILLPVMGVWVYRMWKLFRAPEEYFFTRVKLETFHQKPWYRAMYFTVVIDHPEEGTVAADTNPIFSPIGWEQPLLEDYQHKTVTVGYNRETGMVVVLD